MKKTILFLLPMLFGALFLHAQFGTMTPEFEKTFKKLVELKKPNDYGGCDDTATVKKRLRITRASLNCLRKASNLFELMIVKDEGVTDAGGCQGDVVIEKMKHKIALIVDSFQTEMRHKDTVLALGHIVDFLKKEEVVLPQIDTIGNETSISNFISTKKPLAQYSSEQIVILMYIAADDNGDWYWDVKDVRAAAGKLTSTKHWFLQQKATDLLADFIPDETPAANGDPDDEND